MSTDRSATLREKRLQTVSAAETTVPRIVAPLPATIDTGRPVICVGLSSLQPARSAAAASAAARV